MLHQMIEGLNQSQYSGSIGNYWWLQSPYSGSDMKAHDVNGDLGFIAWRDVDATLGIRPALKLNLSSVIFSSEINAFAPVPVPSGIDIGNAKVTVEDQVYNGKKQTPKPTVNLDGKTLTPGTDYSLKYKNNKETGLATVTVTGKGDYTGSVKGTFTINPKKVKGPSVTAGKREVSVEWKVDRRNDYDGYQIEIDRREDFTTARRHTIKNPRIIGKIIGSLKKGKTYYIRIRTWKKNPEGKRFYSVWSKTFKADIK